MKFSLWLTVVVFVLCSCNKDKNEIEINREVESFSNASFKRYAFRLSVKDCILNEDGSLVVVGNGKEENSFLPQPFILTLDLQKEISWLTLLIDDRRNIYRDISLIPDLDENYVVLSYSDADNLSGFDADLSKVTPYGNLVWNNRIAEENKNLISTSIIQLPDSDYIVYSRGYPVDSLESSFLQLDRISWSGALIWTRIIDESKLVASRQMILFPESNCFIALSEHGPGLLAGQGEFRIRKFDFDGNVLWQETIVAPGSIWPLSGNISPLENDYFMITFSSNSLMSDKNYDATAIKMDQEGNKEWEKTYTGSETEVPEAIIPTQDGKYVLLANTSSFGNGAFDVMLSKIDTDGALLWDKVYGGPASDQGRKVVERNNGNLVVMGNTNEGNSSDAIFDLFVLETDPEGNPE